MSLHEGEYRTTPSHSHREIVKRRLECSESSSDTGSDCSTTGSISDASQSVLDTDPDSSSPSLSPSPNYVEMRPLIFQDIVREIDEFGHVIDLFNHQQELMFAQIRNIPEGTLLSEPTSCVDHCYMDKTASIKNNHFNQDSDYSSFHPQFCSSAPSSDRR
jgi:hypothetical protein